MQSASACKLQAGNVSIGSGLGILAGRPPAKRSSKSRSCIDRIKGQKPELNQRERESAPMILSYPTTHTHTQQYMSLTPFWDASQSESSPTYHHPLSLLFGLSSSSESAWPSQRDVPVEGLMGILKRSQWREVH